MCPLDASGKEVLERLIDIWRKFETGFSGLVRNYFSKRARRKIWKVNDPPKTLAQCRIHAKEAFYFSTIASHYDNSTIRIFVNKSNECPRDFWCYMVTCAVNGQP